MNRLFVLIVLFANACISQAQEQLKYSHFDSWLTRDIKESILLGGKTKTLYEIGPKGVWDGEKPYTNQGGSPWATSNVLAKVAGVVKTNCCVTPERRGTGSCVKLTTHVEGCKVLGVVNIHVLAAGSLYLGSMQEPITSSTNPMRYLNYGIPFTHKPKAVQFDYKVRLTNKSNRIRQTGFSPVKTVSGKDFPDMICLVQKRWEDAEGNILAKRIGTCIHHFTQSSDWRNAAEFEIHYGDITKTSYYKPYMDLFDSGDFQKYAMNSKGKMVPVKEIGWADASETPTHLCLQFASSYGGAYIGTIGTTLWIDNLKLVY